MSIGPVAQWITRLTTDQKIPGSNPGRFDAFVETKLTKNLIINHKGFRMQGGNMAT